MPETINRWSRVIFMIERCGAKRRNGEPCQQYPIKGRNRCRLHGGKTRIWFAHPNYKTGEYSKYDFACAERKVQAKGWKIFKRAYRQMQADGMSPYRLHERAPVPKTTYVAPVRCGAKNRQGNPCQKWPIKGRNRCRNHGGKSLRGVDSPSFKNGRYSKLLPRDLLGRYLRSNGL